MGYHTDQCSQRLCQPTIRGVHKGHGLPLNITMLWKYLRSIPWGTSVSTWVAVSIQIIGKNEFKDTVRICHKHVSESLCSLASLGLSLVDFIRCQLYALLPGTVENIIAKHDTVLEITVIVFAKGPRLLSMIELVNTAELSSRTELGDAGYKHNSMIQKRMKVTGGRTRSGRIEDHRLKGTPAWYLEELWRAPKAGKARQTPWVWQKGVIRGVQKLGGNEHAQKEDHHSLSRLPFGERK